MTLEALLTPEDLGKLMGLSPRTVQSKASKSPGDLPPRAPCHLLRWHPKSYETWAMNATPRRKVGRPRG